MTLNLEDPAGKAPVSDAAIQIVNNRKIEALLAQFPGANVLANVVDTLPASPRDGEGVYFKADAKRGTLWHLIYDATAPTACTITIASPGVVSQTAHGFIENESVVFTTTGALPTGLTAGTIYYTRPVSGVWQANTFTVATTKDGTAINTSGSQSGTHTVHSPYRWIYAGGGELFHEIVTDETFTSASGFQDPATPGPTITLPLEGDYVYTHAQEFYRSSSADSDQWATTLNIGVYGATFDAEFHVGAYYYGSSGGTTDTPMHTTIIPGLAAGTNVKMKYYCSTGSGANLPHVRYRRLMARPLRVMG